MSDLFGNHIVGFPMRRLIFHKFVPEMSLLNYYRNWIVVHYNLQICKFVSLAKVYCRRTVVRFSDNFNAKPC